MSLFKARDWWSTVLGEKEEFDQGCLCLADVDNSGNGQVLHDDQKRASDNQELELQVVLSHLVSARAWDPALMYARVIKSLWAASWAT